MPDSKLWETLRDDMKLYPRLDCKPSIAIMEHIDQCVDPNVVYEMKDPDCKKLKTDVMLFAQTENWTPVRVLCQLSVQKADATSKANEAQQKMFKKKAIDGTTDYRLFLASMTTGAFSTIEKTLRR